MTFDDFKKVHLLSSFISIYSEIQDWMIDPFPHWDLRYLELSTSLSLVFLVNGASYETSFESVVSAYVLSSSLRWVSVGIFKIKAGYKSHDLL